MTQNELRRRFPNAAESFVRLNSTDGSGTPAELECDSGNDALVQIPVQATTGGPVLVRVKSFRHRLIDEDNLCEKFHVDLCRYAGIIPADDPSQAHIQVTQEKIPKTEEEWIEIVIERID